jgi:hypothetical protein
MNGFQRKRASIACAILALVLGYVPPALGQPLTGPSQLIVACRPDKPIVRPEETVALRAYVASPASGASRYKWTVSVGRLEGNGDQVLWTLKDATAGVHEAGVAVTVPDGVVASCGVRVAVQPEGRGEFRGNRETGRSFLLPNQVEERGFGLFSYILLGSRPNTGNRERYLKTLEEYLRFPDIARFEIFNAPRRTLNITYLPTIGLPGKDILDRLADEHYRETAEWMLKRYDYERARLLLRGLPGNSRDGPYIVSFLRPPNWSDAPSRPYLYQDQSSMPPELASLWMKEFLNQAAQEKFWEARTAAQFALKLRTSLRVIATGLPEVRKALDEWIAWAS